MVRTYECNGLTVEIGAELIFIAIDGQIYTPQEKKKYKAIQTVKTWCKEFWSNSYFNRHTKTHLTVKLCEIGSRVIGWAAIYQAAKKELLPYLPQVYELISRIEWGSFIFHVDVGFAMGVFVTMLVKHLKYKFTNKRV